MLCAHHIRLITIEYILLFVAFCMESTVHLPKQYSVYRHRSGRNRHRYWTTRPLCMHWPSCQCWFPVVAIFVGESTTAMIGKRVACSSHKSRKAIPIKCFVSHRSSSREGGSVGRAKKKGMTWLPVKAGLQSTKAWLRWAQLSRSAAYPVGQAILQKVNPPELPHGVRPPRCGSALWTLLYKNLVKTRSVLVLFKRRWKKKSDFCWYFEDFWDWMVQSDGIPTLRMMG